MMKFRMQRGFTLVEVLIATVIIALGVLGLLALFAGAARQQQTATQTTLAGIMARNAQAVIAPRFRDLQTTNTTSVPDQSVWLPIAISNSTRLADNPPLTINPNGDGARFFVVDGNPETLYTYDGMATGHLGNGEFSNGMPMPPLDDMVPFAQRRILPDSLVIRVTITDGMSTLVSTYFRGPPPGPGMLTYPDLDDRDAHRYAYPNSGNIFAAQISSSADLDYILVDVQENPRTTEPRPAFIAAMRIKTVVENPMWYIESIEVDSYEWKNDQLVSLTDRIHNIADESAEDGVRPYISYSLLYMQDSGVARMAVVTYQMTPDSGGAEWLPPETAQHVQGENNQRAFREPPLRRARLNLAYDETLRAYYVSPANNDEQYLWAMATGQLLTVAGFSSHAGNIAKMGSENSVRVTRRERRVNGTQVRWRAYLDDSPRRGGISLLPTAARFNGQVQPIDVYAVNDVVVSTEDDSQWKLKPLQVNVVQVVSQ